MLGSPILYLKGMRAIMFQLSGFYYKRYPHTVDDINWGLQDFGVQGLGLRV